MRLLPVALLLVGYLLLEIAVLVAVGGEIGVLATILIIIATAVLGAMLLRLQGFGLLARIRNEAEAGRVPSREFAHGFMILIAGVLLMTPGFVSDLLGLLLFLPPVRDLAWHVVRHKITAVVAAGGGRAAWTRQKPRPTIDLDEADYSRGGGAIPPRER